MYAPAKLIKSILLAKELHSLLYCWPWKLF